VTRRKVFVSSVYWGLQDVREDIYKWASSNGYDAWVFEKSDPLLGQTPPANIQRVCLRHVDESALYIAIFNKGYGSSAKSHLANVSLVDLEFFEAFKEGKPIRAYILEPFTPEPELAAFVEIVSAVIPGSVKLWGLVKNALFIFTLRNASYGPGNPIYLASGQFRNHKSVKQL
jgi:Domain of unknown function (DUF4062)